MGSDSPRTEAAALRGAIFTTTPDGGIVNENVRYEQKIEVYLDGGPPQNAPQTAAGLPDGDYVFQVTDPSGKVLLSEDASVCRVLRVDGGVIVALRDTNFGFHDHTATDPCHINDDPEGAAGASGRHDTNVDVDHGADGAIVVQLMPLDRYLANGGDLGATPEAQCVNPRNGRPAPNCGGNKIQVGFERDDGFGPARDQVKTDNFKVKEFEPPMLHVRKFHDINGDGIWQQNDEPEIGPEDGLVPVPAGNICVDGNGDIAACNGGGGWPIEITEPITNGPVTNNFFTPVWVVAEPSGDWLVCEGSLDGWTQSAAYLDDPGQTNNLNTQCVTVVVAGTSGESHEVIFGNFMEPAIHGTKFIDLNANGVHDGGEGCPAFAPNNAGCEEITIHLIGVGGTANGDHDHTTTNSDGDFWFMDLLPGDYRLCEEVPSEFIQSFPATGPDCSSHSPDNGGVVRDIGIAVSVSSGDVSEDNDFGNFSLAEVHGLKFFDHDGNGQRDTGDEGIAGVEIHLFGTDGMGQAVHLHTSTNSDGEYWFMDLVPGDYDVCEEPPANSGLFETLPSSGADCTSHPAVIGGNVQPYGYAVSLESDQIVSGLDFGNFGPCDGLTPGYWKNWRNHYTDGQILILLAGTIAPTIAEADDIFADYNASPDNELTILRAMLLANQLTLNLTMHPELPNPGDAGLVGLCTAPGVPDTLAEVIQKALDILANPGDFTRAYILDVKNDLDTFANLNG